MSRDDARREVRRAVDASWTRGAFAEKAKVDPGTLADFIEGRRWPQAYNRSKIEGALGWPPGRIADLEESGTSTLAAAPATMSGTGRVIDARPVGLGLDDEAMDLRPEQIEAVRAMIRAMKPPPETP